MERLFDTLMGKKTIKTDLSEFLDLKLPNGTKVKSVKVSNEDPEIEARQAKALLGLVESGGEEPHAEKLSTVIEAYCREQLRLGRWREKTEADNRAKFALLLEIVGDVPIDSIKHEHLRAYKETLMRLPSNMNKSPRYRGKSLKEIVDMDDVTPMAVDTLRKQGLPDMSVKSG